MKNLSMIACISQDLGLGNGGELLWNIPADMKFFRETTAGHVVVMGRTTFESIGRPLPRRQNVVLSSRQLDAPDVTVFRNQAELTEFLNDVQDEKFIIGGASLYAMFLPEAEKLYLTEVVAAKPADVYFPEFDKAKYTRKVLGAGEHGGVQYEFVEYTRRGA